MVLLSIPQHHALSIPEALWTWKDPEAAKRPAALGAPDTRLPTQAWQRSQAWNEEIQANAPGLEEHHLPI